MGVDDTDLAALLLTPLDKPALLGTTVAVALGLAVAPELAVAGEEPDIEAAAPAVETGTRCRDKSAVTVVAGESM